MTIIIRIERPDLLKDKESKFVLLRAITELKKLGRVSYHEHALGKDCSLACVTNTLNDMFEEGL